MSGNPLGEPRYGWIFELGGAAAFIAFLIFHTQRTIRSRELSIAALAFVSCLTMAWQEWYADWGAYLLYNEEFALLPWGSTTWTTPNKPWAVLAGYGWFYSVLFPVMLAMLAWLRRKRPGWSRTTTVVVVAAPVLYLWNFASADGLAARFGWWGYVETYGPTVQQARGEVPLLYPLAFFVLFAVVALWCIDDRDDKGRPRFERLLRADRQAPGPKRELRRAGAWILALNAIYLVTLIVPLVAFRELFGDESTLVP